jgi:hypothetical protein
MSALLGLAFLTFNVPASAAVAWEPAGKVRFYQVADSDFDVYTKDPTPAQQDWMRQHYARMTTWTSYFDSRLKWYPNGWAYKNAFAAYPGKYVATQHPEWILRDASGNLLYIDFACSGGTCPQYAADFGNPAFRSWWINEAKAIIAKGYRGFWIDDVNLDFRTSDGYGNNIVPIDPRTGSAMTITNWRRYMAEFMEQVRAAMPTAEIAHNSIWYAGSPTDPYVQRQVDAADYINLERGVNDKGLVNGTTRWGFETFLAYVDFIHGRNRSVIMMNYGSTTTEREFGLAGLLLANEGRDLIHSNQLSWSAPDKWWNGFDTNLRESKGGRYKWNGLLRRDFQCGIVLANQPGASTVTAALPKPYTTIEGNVVTSVTLQARQAKVLKSSDCSTSGGGCH